MANPSPKLDPPSSIDEDKPVDLEATTEGHNVTENKDPNLVEYDGPDDPVRHRKTPLEVWHDLKYTDLTMNNARAILKTSPL